MKTIIINGHPSPDESQTQRFFYESIQLEQDVTYIELAKQPHFNFLELKSYDRIILQFPVYWYSAPSLLKEWLDTQLSEQFSWLNGKEFGIVPIFDTSKKRYGAGLSEQFTPDEMLRPYQMIAHFFKMTYLPIFPIFQFNYLKESDRKVLLIHYLQYVTCHYPMSLKQRGKWLLRRLKQLENTKLLVQQLEEDLECIDELNVVLKEMKNG